ncbi:MAG: Ig-like domain-containing protein, partial [Actinobacteria bacterium]|nr:Ig-like domain-containing protein [Actinomycetota bacterium]
ATATLTSVDANIITVTGYLGTDNTGLSVGAVDVDFEAGASSSYSIDTIDSPQTAGTPFEITITAQDGNLNIATGYSGTATLSTTAGTITPGTANFTAGVATLDVEVTDAGTGQTITAVDGTLSATSNTFDVDPGAASEILINAGDGQSAEVGTAVATPPGVIVRDAEGNAVANESVIFEVTSGGGTVDPATAVSTDENGIATVTNWTLGSEAGTDNNTLSATVEGTSLTQTFTASATAGPASQVSFDVQPAPTTVAGQIITPAVVVEIQDSFGNLVDDAANEVSIALTTPDGATLSGTLTQAAESGVATFSDLSVDQTGNYTLTASTSGLDSAESESFEITAGDADAASSDIGADPLSGLTANGADASTLTITVRDGGGNLLEGEPVFFEITGGTGGTLSTGLGTTDATGQATATLTSVDANTITVTGYLGSDNSGAVVGTAEVNFEAGAPATVAATAIQDAAAANGTDDLEYLVTVEDANENPVSVVDVTVTDNGTDITYPSGTTLSTDVNGQVSFTATSATVQSGITFTFTEQDNSNNTTALGSFEDNSGFTVADLGGQTAGEEFTLQISDASGVDGELLDENVNVTVSSDIDEQVHDALVSFSGGTANVPVTLTTADDHTLTVNVDGVSNDQTVGLTVEAGAATQISGLAIADSEIALDGATSVTATILDANANPVPDVTVSFASDQETRATVDPTATTGANGQATAAVTGAGDEAGEVIITASISDIDANVEISDSETIGLTVLTGSADSGQSDIGADPASGLTADGTDASTLSITVRDGGGNLLESEPVFFEITGGTGGTLSTDLATTNASGQATAILTSVDAKYQ